jgi:hypothetical protein
MLSGLGFGLTIAPPASDRATMLFGINTYLDIRNKMELLESVESLQSDPRTGDVLVTFKDATVIRFRNEEELLQFLRNVQLKERK